MSAPAPSPAPRETAPEAVAGRLAFVAALLFLLFAAFIRSPRLFASTHVAHFAGFFAFSLATAAAFKRRPILVIGAGVSLLAVALEAARAVQWLPLRSSYLDWVGDMAGIVGALSPMLLQKIRARFAGPPT